MDPTSVQQAIDRALADHRREHEELEKRFSLMSQGAQDRLDATQRELDKRDVQARELAKTHDAAHGREHAMTDAALLKAETSMDKRLEGMNEFRDTLSDQSGTMVRRDFLDEALKSIAERLAKSEHDLGARMTKAEDDIGIRLTKAEEVLGGRLNKLELASANMAGRLAAMGIFFTVLVIVVNIALRFL